MSRNKQVDRLREGMQKHWTGKIADPVGSALGLMDVQRKDLAQAEKDHKHLVDKSRDEMFSLAQIIIEDKEFFEGLHVELVHVGCTERMYINRKDNDPITLGELGFVDHNPSFETNGDRARLIIIVGMVLAHLRDLVLVGRKLGDDNVKAERKASDIACSTLSRNLQSMCDDFHRVLMDLGIWKDPMPGGFEEMSNAFAKSYEQMKQRAATLKQQRDKGEGELNAQKYNLDQYWKSFYSQSERMSALIKDRNYQRARANQLEKELDQMRESIISKS